MAQGDSARQYQAGMRSTATLRRIGESSVQPQNAAGRAHEVERRAYHAARPGFRIAEMQIGPTQTIPWHYHTEAQDTFYVINGMIRILTREPNEQVCLSVGETYSVRPGRPHLVANAGGASAVFLVLQGMGKHDFVALT
jgi:mannose-6-phosphate isomerase-like protein (cupin superfamily)